MRFLTITFCIIYALCPGIASGQEAARTGSVDVFLSLSRPAGLSCESLVLGRPLKTYAPEYPKEADSKRIGGAVRAELLVGKNGDVLRVADASGPDLFVEPAKKAALDARFSTSKCDGRAIEVTAVLVFNFIPVALTAAYTYPPKAKGYLDVPAGSRFYEPILTLTENYGLTFGYADGGYHPDSPLTKGDFAHFLRKTLDLLQQRAEISKKIPREIELYFALNPGGITSADEIVDLNSDQPYAQSVKLLISKYDIVLTGEGRKFEGKLPLSLGRVLDYWERIFGVDALPVNFRSIPESERIMTRGEFALFLQESLYVLTYKVLP